MKSYFRHMSQAVIAAALAGAASGAFSQAKWDLPSAYPVTAFQTENVVFFANEASTASGGKLQITVHPNASLFKANEIKRAVQTNQAQAGDFVMATYQNEWQNFGVDGIPFLADSYEAARKLYAAEKPVLQKKLASQGMMLLYAVPWPPQGLFVKNKANSLAEFKGGKWRSYGPSTSRMAELAGAQPVVVQGAELSQAVATGVVDGVLTSTDTGYRTKIYETLRYFYDFQAWLPKNAVVVNKKAFDSLDKATQDGVLKAAAAAEERGWKLSREQAVVHNELLSKQGVEIIAPTAQMKDELRRVIGEPMLKEWTSQAGADGQAVIDTYRK